ncbi:MAG: FHA domain-containing protein, partial [Thermoguttaceae bacterium]|nr:FHA domain-containing protein [Thermoguttaceae bacterium]
HPEVSRHHCRLFCHQNEVHIQDLRSLNGTIVGTRLIQNSESLIKPNETFTVGPVQFRINYSPQEISSNDFSGSTSRSRSNSTNSGSGALKK